MRLSIVTICLNEEKSIERNILSVQSQTFRDFEHVIVDGESTDGTLSILEKYSGKIRYSTGKDRSLYDAQNKGLRAAKGDYVLFLNGNDYLADSSVLSKVFDSNPTEDVLFGDLIVSDEQGNQKKHVQPPVVTLWHLASSTIFHPSAFIKRSLFNSIGDYDIEFRIAADYEFFLRAIARHHASTRHVPVTVSVFNTMGLSNQPESQRKLELERRRAQRRNFGLTSYLWFRGLLVIARIYRAILKPLLHQPAAI